MYINMLARAQTNLEVAQTLNPDKADAIQDLLDRLEDLEDEAITESFKDILPPEQEEQEMPEPVIIMEGE